MSAAPEGDAVARALSSALRELTPGPLLVGYSGGLDSSVLLHALAAQPEARARGLGALHVDHGLQADSVAWAAHCSQTCAALGLPLQIERVQVDAIPELGLEAAARRARHAAFARALAPGAVLVLAHHRDDQAETLLLRLLHGAGSEGLAGMRPWRAFASGHLWRPLLGLDRRSLELHARRHDLRWIEDPANADPRPARNALRHGVLPAIRRSWPDAGARLAAAAERLREESDAIDQQARRALAALQGVDPASLSLTGLRRLPRALQRRVIGLWLDALALPRPPAGVWRMLEHDLFDARADALPCSAWRGAELRRYRDTLHALRPLPDPPQGWSLAWDGSDAITLPAGFGRLRFDPPLHPSALWRITPRCGGERLQQAGAHRALRTLLQDLGIPPWVRARLPLLRDASGELVAVADLAFAPRFDAWLRTEGRRLRWQPPH